MIFSLNGLKLKIRPRDFRRSANDIGNRGVKCGAKRPSFSSLDPRRNTHYSCSTITFKISKNSKKIIQLISTHSYDSFPTLKLSSNDLLETKHWD